MSPDPRHLRRPRTIAGAFLAATLLCGCSSEGNNDWGAMFDVATQAWDQRTGDVQLNQAAAIPYATLGFRLSGESEQMLILATDDGRDRLWTSAAHVAITTRHGRIVSTAGFAENLAAYNTLEPGPSDWRRRSQFTWLADFSDIGRYSVRIACEDVPAGTEKIVILGKEIDTLRVDESCNSSQLNWEFSNVYWISQNSNRVWRSIQHIHPKMDPLEVELLRPPETRE